MSTDPSHESPYLLEEVRNALLTHPLLRDQGVQVVIEESRILLTGEVATPDRRDAALAVVHELAGRLVVCADLSVGCAELGTRAERL